MHEIMYLYRGARGTKVQWDDRSSDSMIIVKMHV